MTWYYNKDGAASGPHDEDAMRALIASGSLKVTSLIWQPGMEVWKEAGSLMPGWWQAPATPAEASPPKKESATASLQRRSPQPVAPSEKPPEGKKGLLSRLFGRKK